MAKSKKTNTKKRSAATGGRTEVTTFARGMVWLFTCLSLTYLAVVCWRFG